LLRGRSRGGLLSRVHLDLVVGSASIDIVEHATNQALADAEASGVLCAVIHDH